MVLISLVEAHTDIVLLEMRAKRDVAKRVEVNARLVALLLVGGDDSRWWRDFGPHTVVDRIR